MFATLITMFNNTALDLIYNNEDADVTATVVHHNNNIIMQLMGVKGFGYDTDIKEESVEDHHQ